MLEIELIQVERLRSGAWLRRVNYAREHSDRIWIVDGDDDSPTHNGMSRSMGGDYHGNCSHCWLGQGHSTARHALNLARVSA